MQYTLNYLSLADFFIKKRDVSCGGVEGYNSDFSFSEKELKKNNLNMNEVIGMLMILKVEEVWPKDEDGEKHKDTVIKDYRKKSNKIIIIGCTTEKIERFIKKIKHKIKESVIEVHLSNRMFKYGNNEAQFSNTKRWKMICYLNRNFPKTISYEDLWYDAFNMTSSGLPGKTKMNKQVQNIINGINAKLIDKGFPKDIIALENNEGYRFTM